MLPPLQQPAAQINPLEVRQEPLCGGGPSAVYLSLEGTTVSRGEAPRAAGVCVAGSGGRGSTGRNRAPSLRPHRGRCPVCGPWGSLSLSGRTRICHGDEQETNPGNEKRNENCWVMGTSILKRVRGGRSHPAVGKNPTHPPHSHSRSTRRVVFRSIYFSFPEF